MAQIATVANVIGKAFVVGLNGVVRPLKAGDVIEQGEVIQTADGGRVELLMNDGQMLAVAPEQAMRVDESLVAVDSRPVPQDSAVQAATGNTVIDALNRGGDLTDQLEATAAGAGAGGGGGDGNSFVQLLRIVEPTDPLAFLPKR